MANKSKKTLRVRSRGSVTKEINSLAGICREHILQKKDDVTTPIPYKQIRRNVESLLKKTRLHNRSKINNVLLFVIIFLDGSVKESHLYPFDTCIKREKEARRQHQIERAELYVLIQPFFMDEIGKQEEYLTNQIKPLEAANRVPKSDLLGLIAAANRNAPDEDVLLLSEVQTQAQEEVYDIELENRQN